jgi:phage N-6-adenine-methyltransferase
MVDKVLFSSTTDEWSTPQHIFDEWDNDCQFELDVCATPENAKCKKFFTREDNGLARVWTGRCWMNPPYGREIGLWVEKAWRSVTNGQANFVVCLLPARTDTRWFHDYCLKYGEVTFIRGRLKFGGATNSAPFPSMIVVFR